MDSSPTLQDFVLNLIYDPAARSAFELDPEATLQHAGLGDITAADVQQVIPLVVDTAPVAGLTGLTGVDDLTTGVAHLDVAGAVAQLQTITAQVPVVSTHAVSDVNNTIAGVNATVIGVNVDNVVHGSVLSGDTFGIDHIAGIGGLTSVTSAGVGGLSAEHDPAIHLDNTVVAPVSDVAPTVDGIVSHTGVDPVGVLGGTLDSVLDAPSSIGGGHADVLDVPGVHEATSSVGSLVKPDLGGVLSHDSGVDLHGTLDSTVSGVGGTVHGVTGVLHGNGDTGETSQPEATHDVLGLHF